MATNDPNNQTSSANLGQVSTGLTVAGEVRGALVDKVTGQELGSSGGGTIGTLGTFLGLADAVNKFQNSDKGITAGETFLFDLASNLPGWFGGLITPVAWSREKLLEIFDDGENSARLTKNLVEFSDSLNEFMNPDIKGWYDAAFSFDPRRDPLTFDLDGDGLETVGLSNSPVLFDHDGDGIKNGTGWVSADDAFLVMDKNNNGTIDDGGELFGDNTVKSNGEKAVDGFDALADLDTAAAGGNGDGIVNASDAQFSNLKLWRDLNQDGISQSNELFGLSSQHVVGINIAKSENSIILPNGNELADTGSYIKDDGSVADIGAATGDLGDINLIEDTFNREFPDTLDTSSIAQLPDMAGSGAVRDLLEAATQSTSLQNLLNQFSSATSKTAQMAIIDDLLDAWADTSGYAESYEERIADIDYIAPDGSALPYYVKYENIGNIDRGYGSTSTGGGSGGGASSFLGNDIDNPFLSNEYKQLITDFSQKLHVVESFNGRLFFASPSNPTEGSQTTNFGSANDNGGSVVLAGVINIDLTQEHVDLIESSYNSVKTSVYNALALQTRLQTYLDKVVIVENENGVVSLDFTDLLQSLDSAIQQNPVNGLNDLIDFNRVTKDMLKGSDWNGWQIFSKHMEALSQNGTLNTVLDGEALFIDSDHFIATNKDEIIIGDANDGNIFGKLGDDAIFGGAGADDIDGNVGDDTLTGGTGNDVLRGWTGNDTFNFSLGDGVDEVRDMYEATGFNRVTFTDISVNDIRGVTLSGSDLTIKYGTSDSVTLKYFINQLGSEFTIQQFQFGGETFTTEEFLKLNPIQMSDAPGQELNFRLSSIGISALGGNSDDRAIFGDYDDVFDGGEGDDDIWGYLGNDVLNGGNGDDYIDGNEGDDIVNGGNGNDTLEGWFGNDELIGGDGNDTLKGWAGDDILNGGYGNDVMDGSEGNDTYYVDSFGDVIQEYSGNDTVIVTANNPGAVVGLDLNNAFFSGIENMTVTGTGLYNLTGSNVDNKLIGNASNNSIVGNAGNDLLDGGAGDDYMSGGTGDDVYKVDSFGDSVIEAANEGNDTVVASFDNAGAAIGLSLDNPFFNNVENLAISGTGLYDLYGSAASSLLSGNESSNIISDTAGGNDILIGKQGNDTITSTSGTNVIAFNLGDGQDVVTLASQTNSTISLGGNFDYSDLSLTKSGNDLVLKIGASDQMTFSGWYSSSQSVANLQVIAEAMTSYSAGSTDELRNDQVELFNFANIVSAFDTSGVTTDWQISDATLAAYQLDSSQVGVQGGDLAIDYGLNGFLTGIDDQIAVM